MFSQKILHKIRLSFLFVVFIFFAELAFPADANASHNFIDIQKSNNIEQGSYSEAAPAMKLPEIPDKPKPVVKKVVNITVTAYSSTVDQCGADPFTTASGTKVRDGVIAANFLPIGAKVRIPEKFGDKIFVVEDRMHAKYWYHADIWMPSREQAREWGVKYLKVEIL